MAILIILAILIIMCFNDDKNNTFTVTCDKCGSHDVTVTPNGLKCNNCGAECKN